MTLDENTKPKTPQALPRNLDSLSVEELKNYQAELRVEEQRVRTEIEKKDKHKSTADSLFGKK